MIRSQSQNVIQWPLVRKEYFKVFFLLFKLSIDL